MNRIRLLREQKNIEQKSLATALGVTQPTVSDWETGRKTPSSKSAALLADYFGVTIDYLLGRDPQDASQIRPVENISLLPIVASVRAGWNGDAQADYQGTAPAYEIACPSDYVWMLVRGDSMAPEMQEGDLVLIHLQNTAENGDYIVAILDGEEGTIKKFQKEKDGILLVPLNPEHPVRFIPAAECDRLMIYGVAIEIKRSLR